MKWFSLTLALVCLFALQIVIEAKPVEEDEGAAASATAVDESETPAETPAESNDDTPAESSDDTVAESNDDTPAESNNDTPAKEVIQAPTKKPWTIAGIASDAKIIMDTFKEGLETADQALEFYDKLVDRVVPWKEFNETLVELDKFRKDYSIESAALIGDIKTAMMNGMDAYFSASQNVYEWAGLVTPLLNVYIKLFDKHTEEKAATQRQLLLRVLDEGITKMSAARVELEKSSSSFNDAGGKLAALQIRFDAEFDEKSEFIQTKILQVKIGAYTGGALFGIPGLLIAHFFAVGKFVPQLMEKLHGIEKFYGDLKKKVDEGSENIDKIKTTLKTEVQHITDLKVQTENTKQYVIIDDIPEMKEDIINSVKKLIKNCDDYRKRHNDKTDLVKN